MIIVVMFLRFFFFNDTATTEIYTLSLHDALPIFPRGRPTRLSRSAGWSTTVFIEVDRKSTRLNSSHGSISYAVFCLKKKTTNKTSVPLTQTSMRGPEGVWINYSR